MSIPRHIQPGINHLGLSSAPQQLFPLEWACSYFTTRCNIDPLLGFTISRISEILIKRQYVSNNRGIKWLSYINNFITDFDCIFVFVRNQFIGKSDEYLLTIDRTRNRTTTKKKERRKAKKIKQANKRIKRQNNFGCTL